MAHLLHLPLWSEWHYHTIGLSHCPTLNKSWSLSHDACLQARHAVVCRDLIKQVDSWEPTVPRTCWQEFSGPKDLGTHQRNPILSTMPIIFTLRTTLQYLRTDCVACTRQNRMLFEIRLSFGSVDAYRFVAYIHALRLETCFVILMQFAVHILKYCMLYIFDVDFWPVCFTMMTDKMIESGPRLAKFYKSPLNAAPECKIPPFLIAIFGPI